MTGLPENVEELLTALVEKSRHETNIIMALADAIRRTDEQLLREVRSVTLHHELRREEIKGELQALATRLCALPARPVTGGPAASHHRPHHAIPNARMNGDGPPPSPGWNGSTAHEIDGELAETFGTELPRH